MTNSVNYIKMNAEEMEKIKSSMEEHEYWERMWDEYVAWCREQENGAHEG